MRAPVCEGLDLGQFRSADDGVCLLKEQSSSALVVIGAVMSLCIAVGGTEIVATPGKGAPHVKIIIILLLLIYYGSMYNARFL